MSGTEKEMERQVEHRGTEGRRGLFEHRGTEGQRDFSNTEGRRDREAYSFRLPLIFRLMPSFNNSTLKLMSKPSFLPESFRYVTSWTSCNG